MMSCSQNCFTKTKLKKDLKELENTLPAKYSVWPISSQSIYDCICSLTGPKNTPYENGIFYVRIILPTHNHGSFAHIKFLTKIYHPNINAQSGNISSFNLKKAKNDIMLIIEALYGILKYPNLANSENIEARDCYMNNIEEFNKVTAEWTRLYAS
ncbi:unnamed protein product [Blepharisma stoltei]|uniref:UBC core domain-containing protein n=1 Tax=Blepharisma stoltei TaxID=1481888 RepID=A0AAU9IYR9_9CILI|nr:unnamed protein product [Blepharisma stoltei]